MTPKFDKILEQNSAPTMVRVTLELSLDAVRQIEQLAESDIKPLLEKEINHNTEAFIEMMGYDNW
jgi:hypothetical protein